MSLVNEIITNKEIVVFDFDGVLVNSVNVKTSAFEQMYQQYGLAVVRKVRSHHESNGGMSRFEKFKFYHENYLGKKLDTEEIQAMSKQFSEMVVDKVISADWIPGANKFLEKIYNNNVRCAIVSATPQNEIDLIIAKRGMSKYFSHVYGAPRSKPDNLLDLLKKYSLQPTKLVFFGDALADYEAATEVGITFVGVGKKIKKILKSRRVSDFYIDDFSEL